MASPSEFGRSGKGDTFAYRKFGGEDLALLMKVDNTLLIALRFLCLARAGKQKDDFAKGLSGKIPIGTSQGDAEKILDRYGFSHSFDLKTHPIYAMKRGQEGVFVIVRQDWSAKITLGEFATYRPWLRNCVTFLPDLAISAHRDFISGFCSSPLILFPSNTKSNSRSFRFFVCRTG
jgi:hypothetical protein